MIYNPTLDEILYKVHDGALNPTGCCDEHLFHMIIFALQSVIYVSSVMSKQLNPFHKCVLTKEMFSHN